MCVRCNQAPNNNCKTTTKRKKERKKWKRKRKKEKERKRKETNPTTKRIESPNTSLSPSSAALVSTSASRHDPSLEPSAIPVGQEMPLEKKKKSKKTGAQLSTPLVACGHGAGTGGGRQQWHGGAGVRAAV